MPNKKYVAAIISLTLALVVLSLLLYEQKPSSHTEVFLKPENIERNYKFVSSETSLMNDKSFKITKETNYGPEWKFSTSEIDLNSNKSLTFNYALKAENVDDEILFVASIFDPNGTKNKDIAYYCFKSLEGKKNETASTVDSKWTIHKHSIKLNIDYKDSYILSFYFWNLNKKEFYIDNISYSLE